MRKKKYDQFAGEQHAKSAIDNKQVKRRGKEISKHVGDMI
jgi:hypothetical protein